MSKKIIALFLSVLLLTMPAMSVSASAKSLSDCVKVSGYDPKTDYMALMIKAAKNGSPYALQMGAIYEKIRNYKIDAQKMKYKKTSYFTDYSTGKEIIAAMNRPSYSAQDLDLLAKVIYNEAGCDWIPDWVQQMVGSIVLNRVNSKSFPNTIYDVIYQPGQFFPVSSGMIYRTPSQRAINNAKYLLEHGSVCPANVVYENTSPLGHGIYKSYYDRLLGSTTYFCYI